MKDKKGDYWNGSVLCCTVQHTLCNMSLDLSVLFLYILGRIACMQCIDAVFCYRCSMACVCLSDTAMSCAKTAEPIKMPFGMWTYWVQGIVC